MSRNPNAALSSTFFHLLRGYYSNGKIMFSPLNISGALQLLDCLTQNLANQFEMMCDQNKEDIKTETDYEEPASQSTSDASEKDHSMPVQEATEKTLANEPLHAKENFPFSTSKQDVDPMKIHLTHVLTSTISQLSADENLSSNVPPGNKSVLEGEALEVQSQKEIPLEGEIFDNQCQALENQNRLPNCNLDSEDVRLPSTAAENICSTSQQLCYATKNVEMKNPIQKQGNSIFPPDSEVTNRQQENDPVDTTSQSNFEDVALQLLTREDGKDSGPEQLSLGNLMPQNQISPSQSQKELPQRETMGGFESPSPSTTALLLEWHRGERIQIRQAAERMLKALFQEFKYNVESIETRDLGAEAPAASPSVSPLHFRLACSYLIQILTNAIRSEADSEEDISSGFLPCSEENPGREKNKNVNQLPEANISDGQMNATNSQEELFSSNMDPNPKNLLCNSGAEEAARTPFTDGRERDSRSNLNQGNYEVPFPNEGISSWIFQANARPADNHAMYSFNTCVPQLVSPSHCLPWNKYLQGRENRRAFLHSFNNLEKNVMGNQGLLKTRGYNQHALGQNPPTASRLIGQSHRSLFRSNSN